MNELKKEITDLKEILQCTENQANTNSSSRRLLDIFSRLLEDVINISYLQHLKASWPRRLPNVSEQDS